MATDFVGLNIGGQINFYYTNWDDEQEFIEGAGDEERVEKMIEVFT